MLRRLPGQAAEEAVRPSLEDSLGGPHLDRGRGSGAGGPSPDLAPAARQAQVHPPVDEPVYPGRCHLRPRARVKKVLGCETAVSDPIAGRDGAKLQRWGDDGFETCEFYLSAFLNAAYSIEEKLKIEGGPKIH